MMQTAERTRFTEAEMATVRDTDLPDLLISLGYQVKRIGRYYTTQEMDSIRIKDRRTWFRYSEGIGGDAITFLQRFYNKSFPEAVEYLLTWHGRARDSPSVSTPRQTKEKEEKVPLYPPPCQRGSPKGVCLSPQAWDRTPSDPGLCGGWIAVRGRPTSQLCLCWPGPIRSAGICQSTRNL